MRRHLFASIVAVVILGLLFRPADCQSLFPAQVYERIFTSLDSNGDGLVSAEEVIRQPLMFGSQCSIQLVKAVVAEVDTNDDGYIDLPEFATFFDRLLAAILKKTLHLL